MDSDLPNGKVCTLPPTSKDSVENTLGKCASGTCTTRDLQCRISGIVNTVKDCPSTVDSCKLNCMQSLLDGGNCVLLQGNFLGMLFLML